MEGSNNKQGSQKRGVTEKVTFKERPKEEEPCGHAAEEISMQKGWSTQRIQGGSLSGNSEEELEARVAGLGRRRGEQQEMKSGR